MILTTHALTGAVIGKNVNNPWVIIVLSLAIHFVMDSFRHGEYFDDRAATAKNTWWKISLDLATVFFVIFAFIYFKNLNYLQIKNVFLGTFFSLLPDFMTLLYWTFRWNFLKKIKSFHSWAHRYSRFPKYSPERQWKLRNASNDILISLIAIILLFAT